MDNAQSTSAAGVDLLTGVRWPYCRTHSGAALGLELESNSRRILGNIQRRRVLVSPPCVTKLLKRPCASLEHTAYEQAVLLQLGNSSEPYSSSKAQTAHVYQEAC